MNNSCTFVDIRVASQTKIHILNDHFFVQILSNA